MMFKGLLKLKFVDRNIYEHNKNDVQRYNFLLKNAKVNA